MCWLSIGDPYGVWIWSGCYGLAINRGPLRGMDLVGVLWVGYQSGTPTRYGFGRSVMGWLSNGNPYGVWLQEGFHVLVINRGPLRGMDMVGVLWVGYQTGTPAGYGYGRGVMGWLSNGDPYGVWIWSGCYGLAIKREPLRGMDMVGVFWVGYRTGALTGMLPCGGTARAEGRC